MVSTVSATRSSSGYPSWTSSTVICPSGGGGVIGNFKQNVKQLTAEKYLFGLIYLTITK